MSSHQVSYAQKRRSTRVDQAIPIVVQGVGSMREPYQEQVSTQTISCHGCSYLSKHEVIQGETVYLDIKPASDGSVAYSSKARVKWAQKAGAAKERIFQIAVELEIAGNIWGVAAPPQDWFLPHLSAGMDTSAGGRELKLVTRKEKEQGALAPQVVTGPDGVSHLQSNDAALPMGPLAQMMVGFGEQMQTMASELVVAALVKEKSRLLEEFRAQLREEAVIAMQSAIASSREPIARQALKEFNEAAEASARDNQAHWRKKIEQDMESARQHMLAQERETSDRIESMAAGTIERVKGKMDATRTEAVERFISRIREQVAPMLEIARDSLQKLEGAESAIRKESEAIFAGLESQLSHSTNETLARAQEDLERNAKAITAKANENIQKLYQKFEKATKDNVESLLASSEGQVARNLKEKAAEVSREFSTGLQGYTQSYLESIGKSIAEIPQKVPGRTQR